MKQSNRFAYLSIAASALLLPLSLLVGKLVEYCLKGTNPGHINIHGVLAYLGYIIVSSIVTYVAVAFVAFILGLLAWQHSDRSLAKLAFGLLASELILTFFLLLLGQAIKNL